MKRLINTLLLLIALWQALPALAVTDKEMEQARVIATQTYLRYANDGSGYLDAIHPSTMAELERNLKAKEKENIKAFKAIPVPADYASWDKQKLINYWTDTAFSNSGLLPKGKVGKNPTRKKLTALKIAEPAPAPAKDTKPAAETKPAPAPAPAPTAPKATPQQAAPSEAAAAEQETVSIVAADSAAAEEAQALADAALDDDPTIQKENNYTWVYVVILCILVAIVVALVVFASNVMKRQVPQNPQWHSPNSDEVKSLTRKLQEANGRAEEAERQNKLLQRKIDTLTAELNKFRPRTASSQQAPIKGIPYPKQTSAAGDASSNPMQAPASAQAAQPKAPQAAAPSGSAPQQAPAQAPRQPMPRTIYLGLVNDKGIFIRADRSFNSGNSVYRLDTSDGMAGTFKVVSDPSILEKVIEHPAEMLGYGCTGPDITNTVGLQEIVTDSAGTAIFDNGRWKVLRKAKIHFEY